jgi:amino acid adenylation domain-containing protein
VAFENQLPAATIYPIADVIAAASRRRRIGRRPFAMSGVHELFEAQAKKAPAATAVMGSCTYGELDRRAGRLAAHLRKIHPMPPETLVGIALPPSPELIVAVLAVLKAGGAFVPLDPAYPPERLRWMLDDTRLPIVIGCGVLPHVLMVDPDAGADDHHRATTPADDALAYVMYTSGSTGRPKGIAIPHRGVANTLVDLNQRFGVGAGDRVLFVSSPSFDLSVYEVLGTLAAGAAIVLPDALDPESLLRQIAAAQVTVWSSAPALLQAVLDHADDERLASIRLVLLGGDWVPLTLPDRLRARAPRARVIVMGGTTECSIHSTLYEVAAVDPAWKSIPYGRAMTNQSAYVLDEDFQPAETGELFLGGAGLARGYLGRPDLTAERFLPDPFVAGQRMYRTGDRVRLRPDGNLDLLGRVDQQLKVRGLRIEPGEIEARLGEHPRVRQAVVAQRDGRLVAYCVGDAGAGELRRHLRERLPPYMVPSLFVSLPSLPLTPNGKIDRRALPAPEPRTTHSRAPSPLEEVLLGIAGSVLDGNVGVDDDLLDLGCDSLSALRLVARVRSRLGVALPLRSVFTARTVAGLAAHIVELEAG